MTELERKLGRTATADSSFGEEDARRPHSQDGCAKTLLLVFVQLYFDGSLDLVV